MSLDEIGLRNKTDKASTGHDYLSFYERILGPRRLEIRSLCEFGVRHGASILTWMEWLPNAVVTGVDLEPPGFQHSRFRMVAGDASLPELYLRPEMQGPFDVVIDDCSHTAGVTLRILDMLERLRPGGWLFIEDVNGYRTIADQLTSIPLVLELVREMHSNLKHNSRSLWRDGDQRRLKRLMQQIVMQPGIVAIQRCV